MGMDRKEIQIRCKACSSRFRVLPLDRFAQCPQCHQEWKIKWLDEMIVCDVCEGNPKCVEVCQKQAIQFI